MVREDKYRERVLTCPFCRTPLGDPVETETPFGNTIEAGFCKCGTVYVFDRSGRMLGETYTEALALAFNWDYDKAYSGGELYEEAIVRYSAKWRRYVLDDDRRMNRDSKYYFIRRQRAAPVPEPGSEA
jgi:hypothetical protein